MTGLSKNSVIILVILFCIPVALLAQKTNRPYIELSGSSFTMKSDRAMSYTFHRFDPSLFLGSAHEHFNVDAFSSAEELYQHLQMKIYYPLSDLIDLHLILPWHKNKRTSNNEFYNKENKGLGDVVLGGSYQWYNSFFKTGKEGFTMRLGFDLSLPSGSFENFTSDGELEPQFQAGRGGINPRLFHIIAYTKVDAHFRLHNSYQYSIANKYGYQFGALMKHELSARYFFPLQHSSASILLGINYSKVESDIMNERALFNEFEGGEDTGGQWANVLAELSLVRESLELFAGLEQVVWQSLLGQQFERGIMMNLGLRYKLR